MVGNILKTPGKVMLPLLALVSGLCSSEAEAARQGEMGERSTGKIGILLSLREQVRATGPAEVFGVSGVGESGQATRLSYCVNIPSRTGDFSFSASGSGPGGDFVLTSGSSILGYELVHGDRARSEPAAQLDPLADFRPRALSDSSDCAPGQRSTGELHLVLQSEDQESFASLAHTGTLTLTITPE